MRNSSRSTAFELEAMKTARALCREVFRAKPPLLASDDALDIAKRTYTDVFEATICAAEELLQSGRLNAEEVEMGRGIRNIQAEFEATVHSVAEDLREATR